jgi:hypothetical protein
MPASNPFHERSVYSPRGAGCESSGVPRQRPDDDRRRRQITAGILLDDGSGAVVVVSGPLQEKTAIGCRKAVCRYDADPVTTGNEISDRYSLGAVDVELVLEVSEPL